jgi:DNA ligase (NAD+)
MPAGDTTASASAGAGAGSKRARAESFGIRLATPDGFAALVVDCLG